MALLGCESAVTWTGGEGRMIEETYSEIEYLVDDPVALITLNRPSRMNAFTAVTMKEIRHALERSMADRRAVGAVITGAGGAFCVGLDATSLAEAADRPPDMSAVSTDQPALSRTSATCPSLSSPR
jgi:enoyl-CoA hydratase/carnithine racemase